MKKLTEEFNAVTLTRKEVFQIELKGIPSAGYMWSIENINGEAQKLSERSVDTNPGSFGGSVKQVFTFVATKPGDIEITAVYKRPWEKEAQDTCLFHINVK